MFYKGMEVYDSANKIVASTWKARFGGIFRKISRETSAKNFNDPHDTPE